MPVGSVVGTVVIAGAGHAGGRAAEAMRQAGYTGRIVLVGEESHPPYERPPLSKEMLATDYPPEKAYLAPQTAWAEKTIELRLDARVESLDRAAHRLRLAGGENLAYDRLLIATGGRVRKLSAHGVTLAGIHYIRSIADSLALKAELKPGGRVVVIGGGFIGLEAAAAAAKLGCKATVIEAQNELLNRVMDPMMGRWFEQLHKANGVDVLKGVTIDRFEGRDRVEGVVLATGDRIDADVVVIGIGIVPNLELAADAGIEVGNGIKADEFGVTSDPDVFAVGDVAFHLNPILGRHVRLESWANAQNGGIAVARNMVLAERAPYVDVPWFWTDQFGANIQIAGAPHAWDRIVVRGKPESGKFIAFALHGAKVVGGTAVNLGRDMRFIKSLIQSSKDVRDEDLANEAQQLRVLAG
ncbi:MAG TPA: FAD-dependent oxidoreductase [Alphaproteobacteria bacterium]|nr:FAD-dependent oxidoreductase [Alphaproteobacteria bacterium]